MINDDSRLDCSDVPPNKINIAIDLLRDLEPEDGYYLAFSGGKDSMVIKDLCVKAGVKFRSYYHVTTIDPPELVYYIKKYHQDVVFVHPPRSMLKEMETRGFPLRITPWCCDYLKEHGGVGKIVITGVRKEESMARKNRQLIEFCMKKSSAGKRILNLIVDWTEKDVWNYIKENKLPYCKLYDEGFSRIGCIGCCKASKYNRIREFERWPKFKQLFIKTFEKIYDNKKLKDPSLVKDWKDGKAMFMWWLTNNDCYKYNPDQGTLFE